MHGLAIAELGCEPRLEPQQIAEPELETAVEELCELAERHLDGLVGVATSRFDRRNDDVIGIALELDEFFVIGTGGNLVDVHAFVSRYGEPVAGARHRDVEE